MTKYQKQTRLLAAVDCIIFGFDRQSLKILLIQRGFEPEKGKWSLMGGFIQPDESSDQAATRILKSLTGLEGVYLEQLHTFGEPLRDPIERTLSIAYFALIDIHKYEKILTDEYHPEWFPLNKIPSLIFDHKEYGDNGQGKAPLQGSTCIRFYLNCYQKNSPFHSCSIYMNQHMKPNSISETLAVKFCQPNY